MALPAALTFGTVSIVRVDSATQRPIVSVLTGARASVQEQADGAQQSMPGNESGADDINSVPVFSIFVGGWDENNADGSKPYHHKAGDRITFTADADKPWASIYNGEYRQLVQSAPNAGLNLDYSELLCVRINQS